MENLNPSILGHESETEMLMNILGGIKNPQGLLKYIKKMIAFSILLSDDEKISDFQNPAQAPRFAINKSYSSWISESRNKMIKEGVKTKEEYLKNIDENQAAKNKELEEKFPELVALFEEALKIENEVVAPLVADTEDMVKRMEDLMDTSEEEGPKELMKLLRKLVKEIGFRKCMRMVKGVVKLVTKFSALEKKIKEILPNGEKYDCPGIGLLTGGEPSMSEQIIEAVKKTFTIKNLMRLVSGKDDEIEIGYMTKDGKEAEGEIKGVEVKDGNIEVTIENDKVGDVEKDITEIIEDDGKEDSAGPEEMAKKISQLKAKDPESINKVLSFANFVSNVENKDKISQIDKILGGA